MRTRPFIRGLLGAGLVLAAPAHAAISRTDPAEIRAAAERYIVALAPPGTQVHASAAELDPRLALAPCAGELTPFMTPGAPVRARSTVGVRCPDAGGWSIYVPVTVEAETKLLVAKRPLSRGEIPAPTDLDQVSLRVPGLGTQFLPPTADITGRRLRRPVAAGSPLPADALAAAVLVERGQQVTIVASISGIAVRAGAVALDAGGYGDRIRARNVTSGRIIEGVVQADGSLATNP